MLKSLLFVILLGLTCRHLATYAHGEEEVKMNRRSFMNNADNPYFPAYGRNQVGHPVIPIVVTDDSYRAFPGVTFITSLFTQTLTLITPTSVTQSVTSTGFTTLATTFNVTRTMSTPPSSSAASLMALSASYLLSMLLLFI
jgi:hypothetical protein